MTKRQFIERLENELIENGVKNINDILNEYENHFEEGKKVGKSEEEICYSLGGPEMIAREYTNNEPRKIKVKNTSKKIKYIFLVYACIVLIIGLVVLVPLIARELDDRTITISYDQDELSLVSIAENDVYTTLTGATLAVAKNVLMEDNIKYSVEYTPNVSHDGGLVFGLNDNGYTTFWENANSGIYYYMLMVNFDGIILFAKIDGRTNAPMWTTLYDRSNIKNIDWKKAYTLSVVTNGNNVKGYVDDMLVFSVDVADTFVGTKLGFRSAVAGASYSTISVSPANTGYEFYQRSGQFVNNNGTLSTNVDGGLAWITNAEFTTGTFSADVTASRSSDTGLVFGASNPVDARWEEQPYYFFFVNVNNDALLAGPINGWTTIASGGNISQYLNPYGQPNNLKVEVLDGYVIKCYVNGHLVIEAVAPENARLTGTYAGVRCVGEGLREFSNITITK